MSKINKPNLTVTIVTGKFDNDEDEKSDPYAVLTLGL